MERLVSLHPKHENYRIAHHLANVHDIFFLHSNIIHVNYMFIVVIDSMTIDSRSEVLAMPTIPRISESEWRIMKVVWAKTGPLAAYDIIQELAATEAWRPETIKTLLNRLVKKGALGYKKYKNLYLYYALVAEAESIRAESESFLKRFFDGALEPMLAHFVEEHPLTPAQIQELKRILAKKEGRR
jgi:BlaI family penicillinase repressor